ncbi:MAG: hypothetical protein JWQ40_3028 [Segetibacter sp.]|nr:hypothetical protein [Segetibacter sp.]
MSSLIAFQTIQGIIDHFYSLVQECDATLLNGNSLAGTQKITAIDKAPDEFAPTSINFPILPL